MQGKRGQRLGTEINFDHAAAADIGRRRQRLHCIADPFGGRRGEIEIEIDAIDRRRSRLRVAGGAWTDWTARHERHNRTKAA